jgi:hypothetical protein
MILSVFLGLNLDVVEANAIQQSNDELYLVEIQRALTFSPKELARLLPAEQLRAAVVSASFYKKSHTCSFTPT